MSEGQEITQEYLDKFNKYLPTSRRMGKSRYKEAVEAWAQDKANSEQRVVQVCYRNIDEDIVKKYYPRLTNIIERGK